MKAILFLLICGFYAQPALGKIAEILITDAGRKIPISLRAADIQVEMDRTAAIVSYDLWFQSDRAQSVEGTFYFRLPRDSYVHDFAMWVNGVYQQSVLVEARAGRTAYETITRRGIDPAIVEWTGGNVFKMRVFPISKHQKTRVRLAVGLPAQAVNGSLKTLIPLDLGKTGSLDVTVKGRIVKGADLQVRGLKGLRVNTTIETEKVHASGRYTAKNVIPPNYLFIDQTLPEASKQIVRTNEEEGRYFELTYLPEVKPQRLSQPAETYVFWDYSLSESDDHQARIKALKAYYAARKPKQLNVYGFHNDVFPLVKSKTAKSRIGIDEIVSSLNKRPYDGGTRIDRLLAYIQRLTAKPQKKPIDIVIFSDVSDSYRLFDIDKFSGRYVDGANLFVVTPVEGADRVALNQLVKGFNAVVINLGDTNMAARFEYRPWHVEIEGHSRWLKDVALTSPYVVTGEAVVLRGVMENDRQHNIEIKLANGAESQSAKLEFGVEDDERGDLSVARLWARDRIDRLMIAARDHRAVIEEISVKHQIMSPYVVRVVLETCEDYQEFKITPPKDCLKRAQEISGGYDDYEGGDYDGMAYDVQLSEDTEYEAYDAGADEIAATYSDSSTGMEPVPAPAAASPAYDEAAEMAADEFADYDSAAPMTAQAFPQATEIVEYEFEKGFKRAAQKGVDALYAYYLAQRGPFKNVPYFYIHAASYLASLKQQGLAELVLSNVVEMRPGEARWLQNFAYLISEWGRGRNMLDVFHRSTELRPEDAHALRDYGWALEESGDFNGALEAYEQVLNTEWDQRLVGIYEVIRGDIYRVWTRLGRPAGEQRKTYESFAKASGKITITATWDSDSTDIDLHVLEPSKDHIYYANRLSLASGGEITMDATEGFGPEQYRNRTPHRGEYIIALKFFSSNPRALADGTLVRLDFRIEENGKVKKFSKNYFLRQQNQILVAHKFNYQDKSSSMPPPDYDATLTAARGLIKVGKLNEALLKLKLITDTKDPRRQAWVYFERARIQLRMQQYDKAKRNNEKALALNPDILAARYNIVCAVSLAGDPDEAFHHLDLLKRSISGRFPGQWQRFFKLIRTDPDLDSIRKDGRYSRFLKDYQLAH